jgi:hypothetical protein
MGANSLVVCFAVASLGGAALGQSMNIRFGASATKPSASYGAAGQVGVWNAFEVTDPWARVPVVNLQGTPLAAQLYQFGCSQMLTFDNPATGGDDGKLMDSMVLSMNDPVDACYWVEGMMNGTYEVTLYAMTPNDPSRFCRTRVDTASPGPTMIGGAWPGHHQQGVTYSRFTVTISGGVIGWHSGLYNGYFQSGLNGAQIKFLSACPNATVTMQPTADVVVQPSQPVQLGVAASNGAGVASGLYYQWRKGGTDIAGATATGYSLGPAAVSTSGVYTCRVANACGSVVSQASRVTVLQPDVGVTGGVAGSDGALDNNDFVVFIDAFFNASPMADLGRQGGVHGGDGVFDNNDFVAFIDLFFGA